MVIFSSYFPSVPLNQRHKDDTSVEDTTPHLISILSIHKKKSTFLFLWKLREVSLASENETSFSFPYSQERTQLNLLITVGKKERSSVGHSGQASWPLDGCFASCWVNSTTQGHCQDLKTAWFHTFRILKLVLKLHSTIFLKEKAQTEANLLFLVSYYHEKSVSRPQRLEITVKSVIFPCSLDFMFTEVILLKKSLGFHPLVGFIFHVLGVSVTGISWVCLLLVFWYHIS